MIKQIEGHRKLFTIHTSWTLLALWWQAEKGEEGEHKNMHHQVSANCTGLNPTMCITATSPGVSDSHLLCMLRVFSGLGAPYALQPRFSIAQAKVIEITVEVMYITIGCKANNLSKRSIFFYTYTWGPQWNLISKYKQLILRSISIFNARWLLKKA